MAYGYSFSAVSTTVSHPNYGSNTINGKGAVSVAIAYADDNSEQDLASDGVVMDSKVLSHRGTVAIEVQQTSSFNKWLMSLFNSVYNGDASIWNQISIRSTESYTNGLTISASNCMFQKRPDRKDAKTGDHVTWTFMCDNIVES